LFMKKLTRDRVDRRAKDNSSGTSKLFKIAHTAGLDLRRFGAYSRNSTSSATFM
jgi:hypothetical protein